MKSRFKGKKIAVIGIGTEGVSSKKWLEKHGAFVTVLDQKYNKDYLKNLEEYDLIIRSPGINIHKIQNSKFKIQNSTLTSQTKIFFDLCPCPIIGVTGTKGKGTTSSLIYEMLQKQRLDAYLGGNIGKPPLDFLDKLNPQSIVVLELSSFQLQDLQKSPHIGVMLMTTSEHLDYHKDLPEYIESKRNLLRFQDKEDFAVINKDYVASRESDILTNGQIYQISREDAVSQGCYVKDGKIMISFPEGTFSKKIIDIVKTSDILLPGEHNLENVCAAVMATYLAGVAKQNIAKVLKTFKGLEHRLELVGEAEGVRYYDDSFSTTPETAIAAIKAFIQPEILILGGSSKRSDFKHLGEIISNASNIKAIIGIGEEWIRIKFELPNSKIPVIEGCKNMKEIVKEARKLAEKGDVVLLSPACASFGMFKNYKDRGDQFKEEIKKLKN